MDSTKELCSDHRHRILHNLWGIRRVMIPIFGSTIINAEGKIISVKDICEQDHILPDYNNRFIPTLSDFIDQFDELNSNQKAAINKIHKSFELSSFESELLLSPLSISGKLSSLLITHNSWFINEILPKISNRSKILTDFPITPSELFNKIKYAEWMDNGRSKAPNSVSKILELT